MAKNPDGKPDPMARDVDRLLAQLALFGRPAPTRPQAPRPAGGPSHVARPRIGRPVQPLRAVASRNGTVPAAPRAAPLDEAESPGRERLALWARVGLGVTFGVLMTQWPYPNACGVALLGYGGAVVAVMITGGWLAFESWRLRSGAGHVIALLIFYWGLVLAGEQVIPRISNMGHRPSWRCSASELGVRSSAMPVGPSFG